MFVAAMIGAPMTAGQDVTTEFTVEGDRMTLTVDASGPIRLPRVYAAIRDAVVVTPGGDRKSISIHPETDHWAIRDDVPNGGTVEITFDSTPSVQPITVQPRGDHGIWIGANAGVPHGEKLRFEPQPHKNCIGYWTVADDYVDFAFRSDRGGRFNVGILMGSGVGQGGRAIVTIYRGDEVVDSIAFEAEPTGHFQNFIWRHIGTIDLPDTGEYTVRIAAKKINHKALMDVRALHINPRPID